MRTTRSWWVSSLFVLRFKIGPCFVIEDPVRHAVTPLSSHDVMLAFVSGRWCSTLRRLGIAVMIAGDGTTGFGHALQA